VSEIERGITVGKSWPRAATPCSLVPRWEGEFVSHADWVNFATKRLTVAHDSNGNQLKAICVDALGRRCANGRDMQRAHDEGAFPVRYFWDCEPSAAEARIASLEAERAALLEAARTYAERYLLDERDNPALCVDADHHKAVLALFAALQRSEAGDAS